MKIGISPERVRALLGTPQPTKCELTSEQVRQGKSAAVSRLRSEVTRRRDSGESLTAVAADLGISKAYASMLHRGLR